MRSFASIVAVLLLVMLGLGAAPANAEQVFPTLGGTGGGEAFDRCNPGMYLIGVRMKSGGWVDQISLICAEIHENANLGVTTASYANVTVRPQHFGGNGGGAPVDKECSVPGERIGSLGVMPTTTRSVDVRTMDLHCVSIDNQNEMIEAGNSSGLFPDPSHIQTCMAGQAATGLHMRWGAYLDAVGLICDRFLPIKTTGTPVATTVPPSVDFSFIAPPAESVIFNEQNNYRKACGARTLLWSKSLALDAQRWVQGCHKKLDSNGKEFVCHENDSTCPGNHASDTLPGENLSSAWNTDPTVNHRITDGGNAASSWICEWKNYHPSNPQLIGGDFTSTADNTCPTVNGHFTQVVWEATREIGCASQLCTLNNQQQTVWDCKYRPAGNNPSTLSANVPATCPDPHIK
jgi:Cysteine-rich secretory protein family